MQIIKKDTIKKDIINEINNGEIVGYSERYNKINPGEKRVAIISPIISNEEEICYLIKYHDDAITESDILNNYELACKRYQIQECDALAHHPEKLEKRKRYLERTRKLLNY